MIKNRELDHIGLASVDVEADAKWYQDVLGFEVIGHFGPCYFIQNGTTVYEMYPGKLDPAVVGKIDHIAYKSTDIDADYNYCVEQGYEICTKGIEEISRFWENGIRYFKIKSPGGEQIEFVQKL